MFLFAVLSIAILVGWFFLDRQLWPRKPKTPQEQAKVFDKKKYGSTVAAAQLVAGAFDGNLGTLQADLAYFYPPLPRLKGSDLDDRLQTALMLTPPQMPGALVILAAKLPKPLPPTIEADRVTLGGDGFHLQATLTSHGAGVEKLVVNRFDGVNWVGRGTGTKLELIQEDKEHPSFLMYHYPTPGAKQPVVTLGEQTWHFEKKANDADGVQEVVFTTNAPRPYEAVRITKTYRLGPKDYHLGLSLEFQVQRDQPGETPPTLRYQLAGSHGMPIEGEWYTSTFRSAVVGMVDSNDSLWRELKDSGYVSFRAGSEKIPLADRNQTLIQYAGVMTQYFASMIVVDDQQPKREHGGVDPRKILAWARTTPESEEVKGRITQEKEDGLRFLGADGVEHFYTLLPRVQKHLKEEDLGEGKPAVLSYYVLPGGRRVATWIRPGQTQRPQFDDVTVRVNSEPVDLKPGTRVAHQFMLYHGPVKTALLGQFSGDKAVPSELVDRYTHTLHLNTLTDYASDNWLGSFSRTIHWTDLLILCTKLMHWLLNWLQYFVPIPGLSIILLTVIVRGAMFPISRKQALFSIRMQELAPELKKIGEKYKSDPQAKTQAMMELYRKHKIHPLSSCFPLLLQLPIFLGLYYCLQESVVFRLSGFLWIDNLTAPDMFLWWGQGIPFISDPDSQGAIYYLGPYLNLLPLAAVTLMIVQQKYLTPPPTDADQAAQQRMMRIMMGVMGIMFYKVAAGLCIYFISSSLWGLAERRLLPKKPDPNKLPSPAVSAKLQPGRNGPGGGKNRGKSPPKKEDATAFQKMKAWWENVLKQAEKK